jgi:HTH-type transcriptional regulator, global nitrogen regulator NrpRI
VTFERSERKSVEILRILSEQQEPLGAKRLSELMAERGFSMSDRAVQYYLQYLDEQGFTRKVGNKGRVLTAEGFSEAGNALVDDRMGYVISRLEQLSFNVSFDPKTRTGDIAYNLTYVPYDEIEAVTRAYDEVIDRGYSFFQGYSVTDNDPRLPPDTVGFISACSITMDGVLQKNGIGVDIVYGGRFRIAGHQPICFDDLIRYRGTTIDPLQLFINAGLTSVDSLVHTGSGVALANVREVTVQARERVEGIIDDMADCGFVRPVGIGTSPFNLRTDPYRLSIVFFSGMNLVANAIEQGCNVTTDIGAGIIPFSKIADNSNWR